MAKPKRENRFLLASSDGHLIEAPLSLQRVSKFFKNLYKDLGDEVSQEAIPLMTIDAVMLSLIIDWHNKRLHWDLEELDEKTLFGLVSAANFLDIEPLLNWSCKRVAATVNINESVSFNTLPDEIKALIGRYLTPYMLHHAVNAGTVPLTPEIERCARHAHVWSTVLTKEGFSYLDKIFADCGNAFILGRDVEDIYESYPEKPTSKASLNVLLTWIGKKDIKNSYTSAPLRTGVSVTVDGPAYVMAYEPDEFEKFVSKDGLQTAMLYYRGDNALHRKTLQFKEKHMSYSHHYILTINKSQILHKPFDKHEKLRGFITPTMPKFCMSTYTDEQCFWHYPYGKEEKGDTEDEPHENEITVNLLVRKETSGSRAWHET